MNVADATEPFTGRPAVSSAGGDGWQSPVGADCASVIAKSWSYMYVTIYRHSGGRHSMIAVDEYSQSDLFHAATENA